MSFEVSITEMMDAGVHFGHQTKRWNPKMRPYLYGARSGVHIIDLQKTQTLAEEALAFITQAVAQGKNVLFLGTKTQARDVIREQADRAKMYYVVDRWMGGTLTNFATIKKGIDRLIDFETRRTNNDFAGFTKRELLDVDRMIEKLQASLGGIKALGNTPGVIFVIDPKQEEIAIKEARKLNIPIVALTDTNCDPDPIDYVIPANDDALASIAYFTSKVADACIAGLEKREQNARSGGDEQNANRNNAKRGPSRRSVKGSEPTKNYVARSVKEQGFEGDAGAGFSAKTEEPAKVDGAAKAE